MSEVFQKFMKLSTWLTLILFCIRCLISFSNLKELVEAGKAAELGYNLFGYAGEAIGVSAALMAIYNKWAWRWKIIHLTNDMPILASEYKGFLCSNYDKGNVKKDCSLKVRQTFLNVSVQLKTNESFSKSKFATVSSVDDVPFLIYIYDNKPRGEIQDKSPIHLGTAMLRIEDDHLEGNYYTGRDTRGSIQVDAVKHSDKGSEK